MKSRTKLHKQVVKHLETVGEDYAKNIAAAINRDALIIAAVLRNENAFTHIGTVSDTPIYGLAFKWGYDVPGKATVKISEKLISINNGQVQFGENVTTAIDSLATVTERQRDSSVYAHYAHYT